ncbi:CU044_5270 family protein [Streptomyces sp. NPDC005799]|uniref:CU044_5270 family protein n=1 Tax=Streptomyces sp. NPDC005799 TaxID=3154678 RepID=UPI0033F2FBEB
MRTRRRPFARHSQWLPRKSLPGRPWRWLRHDVDVLDFPGADRLRAAGDVASPSPSVVSAARTAVRAAATDSETVVPLTSPRGHRNRRRVLGSAAAVAAIAVGAAVYPTVGVGSSPPAAEVGAAGFLHRMAGTAGAGSVPNSPYWKVETRTSVTSSVPGGVPSTKTETDTEWLSRNRFLRTSTGGEVMEFTGLANGWALSPDRRVRFTAGYHVAQQGRHELTSWNVGGMVPGREEVITWDQLKTLPTEPKALRARLLGGDGDGAGGAPKADKQLFNGIDALLANAPADPRLRAALFEVLADIPHVRLVGRVKDGAGRSGTAVELRMGRGSSRLIIDPETSKLLEARTVVQANPQSDPAVIRTTYLSAGPSENAPQAGRGSGV